MPRGSDVLVNVWVRDGDDLIHADAVAGRGRATRLRGVTIYERSGGRLDSILSAQTAAPVGQGWRLDKITRFTVSSGTTETLPSAPVAPALSPDPFTLSYVAPATLKFLEPTA